MPMLAIAITSTTSPIASAHYTSAIISVRKYNTADNEIEQVSLHFFTCANRRIDEGPYRIREYWFLFSPITTHSSAGINEDEA
jgi:hypothetical protein